MLIRNLMIALFINGLFMFSVNADNASTDITFIHLGDIHGHLIPRPHLRSDGNGQLQGGLARMYHLIETIRQRHPNSLLINTGDTIQGSAEALYTEGQALVDVLNLFKIDAFAPGNWDFVYGEQRFRELFSCSSRKSRCLAPWGALSANLYDKKTGKRLLPAYQIRQIGEVKVGILGFTSERGPMVVGAQVVDEFRFSHGDAEMAEFIPKLRNKEKVDLLVVISELGLANNIRLAEAHPGIDIVLSSDMHEETPDAVRTSTGTLVVEEGQDGTRVGEFTAIMQDGKMVDYKFKMHIVDASLAESPLIAQKIADIRKPFVKNGSFSSHHHINPINGLSLTMPIDTVIGDAKVPLYRANYANEEMPAVIEGSSHNFLTDAFRVVSGADLGLLRGFRYGTHIAPGPIKLEDIYHYIPIGPFIAKGEMSGKKIRNVIEKSADGSLATPKYWKGGWLFAWSGITFDLEPTAKKGERSRNIQVLNAETGEWQPLVLNKIYTVASYNYAVEPNLINKIPAKNVKVVKDKQNTPLDATDVVVEYLKQHPANPGPSRIHLLSPLPPPAYKNLEIQPLLGANYSPDPLLSSECQADMKKYCSNKSGKELKMCSKQHYQQLQLACKEKILQSLEDKGSCTWDRYKYCSQYLTGRLDQLKGKLLGCYVEHFPVLSKTCQQKTEFLTICEQDMRRFCESVKAGGGRVTYCLKSNFDNLTVRCGGYLLEQRKKKQGMG